MANNIHEVLDIEPHEIAVEETTQVVVPADNGDTEDSDFDYARGNYYEIIEQGKAAVNTAMRIASESENPRSIEVLSGLLKNMADINKQLILMSKDKYDAKSAKGQKQIRITTTDEKPAVFVGSSSSLNKILTDKLKEG